MSPERVQQLVDAWHDGDTSTPLHEYLGWTWEQYKLWVESGIIPDS